MARADALAVALALLEKQHSVRLARQGPTTPEERRSVYRARLATKEREAGRKGVIPPASSRDCYVWRRTPGSKSSLGRRSALQCCSLKVSGAVFANSLGGGDE
jgi:hypothetical protein